MIPRQTTARKAHIAAIRTYEIAAHGERAKTRKKREAAALEVLQADNEAEKEKAA